MMSNVERKKDLLNRLDRILEWIKSCDDKSAILLSGSGLLLTIITFGISKKQFIELYASISSINEVYSYILGIILLIVLLSFLGGIVCFVVELNPRLERRNGQKKAKKSLYYFNSISNYEFSEFSKMVKKSTVKNDIDDVLIQIYENSKICTLKYRLTKWGTALFICSFVSVVVLMGILYFTKI
ncbi:DUF5706 domain-containing protein [Lactobacillus sp. YT155]|uniref:Pycsar system effector family protein n=1 Tax=Lactobacillus sp. YT155 TaxID=3060955 RepID=UPI00265EA9CB|nr:Pycsar system effector family protein [Lactobacillus sp. YT155]MDO1605093.1 DUF5706 domain-containing protein [Lactobacillus sp. YT155]